VTRKRAAITMVMAARRAEASPGLPFIGVVLALVALAVLMW